MIRRLLITGLFVGCLFAASTIPKEPPSPQMGDNGKTQIIYVEYFYKVRAAQAQLAKKSQKTAAPVSPKSTPVVAKPVVEAAPVRATTTAPVQSGLATPAQVAAWTMTAVCETSGNWSMQGPVYSGGLGMMNSTWIAYGGLQFALNAGLATPQEQVTVAMRIQFNPPDPGYCTGSW